MERKSGSRLGRNRSVLSDEQGHAPDGEEPHAGDAEDFGRQMAAGGAGIARVELAIGEAIEGHRGAAGGDHADEDADELLPAPGARRLAPRRPPRHHGCEHRERQREQRVAEADEFEEVADGFEHADCGIAELRNADCLERGVVQSRKSSGLRCYLVPQRLRQRVFDAELVADSGDDEIDQVAVAWTS